MKHAQCVAIDTSYWIGMVSKVDQENEDVKNEVHVPSKSFKWWIPVICVPCPINPPSVSP